MTNATYTVFIYGILVIVGGLFGYIKAGSTASLVMGNIFGIALLVCGLGMMKNYDWAYFGSLLLTAALALFFGFRFITTGAWMPGGTMLIVSLITILILALNKK